MNVVLTVFQRASSGFVLSYLGRIFVAAGSHLLQRRKGISEISDRRDSADFDNLDSDLLCFEMYKLVKMTA